MIPNTDSILMDFPFLFEKDIPGDLKPVAHKIVFFKYFDIGENKAYNIEPLKRPQSDFKMNYQMMP